MKNMIFAGVVFLSIFSNLYGMRASGGENEDFTSDKLEKSRRSTLMFFAYSNPKKAVKKLRDLRKNNLFHLIVSSCDKLTFPFVAEIFRCCAPHFTPTTLEEKNSSGQIPLDLWQNPHDLIEALDNKGKKNLRKLVETLNDPFKSRYMAYLQEKGKVLITGW